MLEVLCLTGLLSHDAYTLTEKLVTRQEFEALQSELQRFSNMGSFTVIDEQAVGRNVLDKSTLNTLDHILAKVPSSYTISLKLQGAV